MGKVASKLTRPIKNFNVENRAQRVLKSEKPRPAPRHPSTIAAFDNIAKDHPEFLDDQKTKDLKLDDFLKQVRVESKGDNPEIKPKTKHAMPEDRNKILPSEYGYPEPDRIPEGRVSLRQALELISQYHLDPKTHTVQSIAEQYKLDTVKVGNVLSYFQTLNMHIPKAMLKKNPKLLQAMEAKPTQPITLTDANRASARRLDKGKVNVDPQQKN